MDPLPLPPRRIFKYWPSPMCNIHTTDLRSYFASIYGSKDLDPLKESDERAKWSISVLVVVRRTLCLLAGPIASATTQWLETNDL